MLIKVAKKEFFSPSLSPQSQLVLAFTIHPYPNPLILILPGPKQMKMVSWSLCLPSFISSDSLYRRAHQTAKANFGFRVRSTFYGFISSATNFQNYAWNAIRTPVISEFFIIPVLPAELRIARCPLGIPRGTSDHTWPGELSMPPP